MPPLPSPLQQPLNINYRGPEGSDGLPAVRAAHILRLTGQAKLMQTEVEIPPDLKAALDGQIVVVGRVDTAAADRFVTPFAFPMLIRADMAGCRVQAQVIDTLVSGRHIRHLPTALGVALAALLAIAPWWTRRRIREDWHTVLWLVVCGALFAAGIVLFKWTDGVVLDLDLPLLACFLSLTWIGLVSWTREPN